MDEVLREAPVGTDRYLSPRHLWASDREHGHRLERGIDKMDASGVGSGGCPYAPGATGNVATEDVLWLLDGLGVEHGLDAGDRHGGP